jgi:replicative DNA helicase
LGEIERIAEEEKGHICLLVQINRSVESKKDKRPTISELRDCGNFEQDADMVFLLYREGYYDDNVDDNILEVKLAKQRDGMSNIWFQFLIADKQTLKLVPMGEKEKLTDKD